MKSGYIQTPVDERDYPVCMAYDDNEDIVLPKSFKTSFQPPYEKQISGNCVAQSLANIMEVMYHKQIDKHDDFSVGFIYGNRKENDYQGEGMTGYMACGNLCKDGDIKSSVYDNEGEVPFIIRAVAEFKEKHPEWKEKAYIPKSYIRTTNVEAVKKFIYKYDIPVMAICETNDFWRGGGYHAMALYGWNGDAAIMQNSWGESHIKKIVELDFEKIHDFWLMLPFSIADFRDLAENHWAYDEISKCVENEIMLGYPDGTFKPDKEMTRAEFCAMIYRLKKEGLNYD